MVKEGYKQTEIGVIPEDWEVKKLEKFVKIESGESPSKFDFILNGIPYYKVEQLNSVNKFLSLNTPYYINTMKTISA